MKAVLQRVINAEVRVEGKVIGSCNKGYLILFCAVQNDTIEDIDILAKKVANLRVFEDEEGKMNKSILDVDGEVLCISQFTLAADTKKGNRPSFIKAMNPADASDYYDDFCRKLTSLGVRRVEKGKFGADMQVSLINDGPVTIIFDTDIWNKNHGN